MSMYRLSMGKRRVLVSLLILSFSMAPGCRGVHVAPPAPGPRPIEGVQVTLDEYIGQPPDILLVEMEANPSDEQVIKAGDQLQINVTNTLPEHPIAAVYPVAGDGSVDLGI